MEGDFEGEGGEDIVFLLCLINIKVVHGQGPRFNKGIRRKTNELKNMPKLLKKQSLGEI